MSLSEEVSQVLNYHVNPLEYKRAFEELDRFGTFNAKKQIEVFAVILEHLEKLENEKKKIL